jgi:type I restriction enzyme R subunit
MAQAFRDGQVQSMGTAITQVLPPVSKFTPDAEHSIKKQNVLEKLQWYLERFLGLG